LRRISDDQIRSAMKRIMTLLTPEQNQRWRDLTGEPFDGPLLPIMVRLGGPGSIGGPDGGRPGPEGPTMRPFGPHSGFDGPRPHPDRPPRPESGTPPAKDP
jgi:hypothetical protein